jgi:hypothetical protein
MDRTWTVFRSDNAQYAKSGLSLPAAADALLSCGGRSWDVRPLAGGGFRLWLGDGGQTWTPSRYLSPEDDKAEAEDEIFRAVLQDEVNGCCALSDEDYQRMMRSATNAGNSA